MCILWWKSFGYQNRYVGGNVYAPVPGKFFDTVDDSMGGDLRLVPESEPQEVFDEVYWTCQQQERQHHRRRLP